jgi:hypothetical protein
MDSKDPSVSRGRSDHPDSANVNDPGSHSWLLAVQPNSVRKQPHTRPAVRAIAWFFTLCPRGLFFFSALFCPFSSEEPFSCARHHSLHTLTFSEKIYPAWAASALEEVKIRHTLAKMPGSSGSAIELYIFTNSNGITVVSPLLIQLRKSYELLPTKGDEGHKDLLI